MEHTSEFTHHTANAETYAAAKKEVKKVTIILSVFTLIELALGYILYLQHSNLGTGMILFLKGLILIFMIVKAFYIVAFFMHLKHELKNMIMTIVVPLALFIWFIIAFLYDGNSYKTLNNTYDPYKKEQSQKKVAPKEHKSEGHGGEEKHATEEKKAAH
jgi:cytochrome c oxidase subunit IV